MPDSFHPEWDNTTWDSNNFTSAAKDTYLGDPDGDIVFIAPIDLLPDDRVIIDHHSGQLLAVYREGRKIWQFEGEYYSGSVSFTGKFDPDVLAALLGAD